MILNKVYYNSYILKVLVVIMSTAGVFTLLINHGKTDKLLNGYDFLKDRLVKYILSRSKNYSHSELLNLPEDAYLRMKDNILPSLNFIEQTHSVFVNGMFKPCIPVAFEYNKISAIEPGFGKTTKFTLRHSGTFINDMVVNIKLSALRAEDSRDRVRYAAFLGHKLFENVKFSVNKNPLDEFTTDDYNAYYRHQIRNEKRNAWLRNIGQEIPELGYITSDPTFDMQREYRWIGNGNQTLKQVHGEVDLYIPLLFWFNNVRNALPHHILPWGQTDVTIKIAEIEDIIGFADYGGGGTYTQPQILKCDLYVNNIFVQPEIFNLYRKKFAFNLIRVHRQHRQVCSDGDTNEVLLHNIKWPIESLYIDFRPKANLALSQYWYKSAKLTQRSFKIPVVAKNASTVLTGTVTSAASNTVTLTGAGLSSTDDTYIAYDFILTGGTGYNDLDIVENRYTVTDYVGATKTATLSTNWVNENPSTDTTFELFTPQLAINLVSYYTEEPVIQDLSLIAHGIEIYKNKSEAFYSKYLPYRFGNNSTVPENLGSYVMNFSLYPDSHHPSGHLNTSIARELYLRYTSDFISSTNQVDLIVLAKTINFLMVKGGTAFLKYSI